MKNKHVFYGVIIMMSLFLVALVVSTSCKKKDTEDEEVVAKVPGCTDPNSLTYNPNANEDDGTCITPEVKQRAIFIDLTATWCTYCGSWGIPYFEQGVTGHPNDVVPLSCHQNDEMSNWVSEALDSTYNPGGIPYLVVGNTTHLQSQSAINNAITSTCAATPIANSICLLTTSGSSITVKAQTKFFTSTSGEYYLAVYFVENGLSYLQNVGGTDTPWVHKYVLRGIAAGNEHGELIASGSIESGRVVNKTYTVTAGSGWNMANVYAALVIWKKSGSNWSYVNAWQTKSN